jgi:hypothetical protein
VVLKPTLAVFRFSPLPSQNTGERFAAFTAKRFQINAGKISNLNDWN